jgi:hypothetical protein
MGSPELPGMDFENICVCYVFDPHFPASLILQCCWQNCILYKHQAIRMQVVQRPGLPKTQRMFLCPGSEMSVLGCHFGAVTRREIWFHWAWRVVNFAAFLSCLFGTIPCSSAQLRIPTANDTAPKRWKEANSSLKQWPVHHWMIMALGWEWHDCQSQLHHASLATLNLSLNLFSHVYKGDY